MCFALVSCEKEELLVLDPTAVGTEIPALPNDPTAAFEDIVVSKALQEKIKANLLKRGKGEKSGLKNEQSFSAYLDTLLSYPARKVASIDTLEGGEALTYFVPTESPNEVLNAVLHIVNEEVVGGYLNLYKMTPEFAARFNAFEVDFSAFEGELSVLPLSKLNELHYTKGAKNTEADCFTFIFDPRNVLGNNDGGSGGNDGNNGDPGPVGGTSPWSGLNFGGSNGVVIVFGGPNDPGAGPGDNPGPGSGGNDGSDGTSSTGSGCIGFEERETGETTILEGVRYVVVQTFDCSTGEFIGEPYVRLPIKSNGLLYTIKEGKSFDAEDCIDLLKTIGVVSRPFFIPSLPAHTQEKIESAIAQTCFDNSAVLSIINVPAFEACVASGSTGPACITQQVVDYLNASGVGNVPGTSLVLTFDNLPHEQQAVFFHALVAAGGNEHVLAAMNYALRNISESVVVDNLAETILLLAKLNFKSSDGDFEANANRLIEILSRCESFPESENILFLVSNIEVLRRLSTLAGAYPMTNMDYFVDVADKIVFEELIEEANSWSRFIQNNFEEDVEELVESDVVIHSINRFSPVLFNEYPSLGRMDRVRGPANQVSNNISHPVVGSLAHLPEDLRWGGDGRSDGINNVETSTGRLEQNFKDLVNVMSARATSGVKNAKNNIVDRFLLPAGVQDDFGYPNSIQIGDFDFDQLTDFVMNTPEVRNSIVKYFEENVENQLVGVRGDINALIAAGGIVFPERARPRFGNYKFSGLSILINDIESMEFRVLPQSVVNAQTGDYSLAIAIQIVDNFGLDYNDAITYQSLQSIRELDSLEDMFRLSFGDGFSSWYVLQHKRSYKPFRTNFTFLVNLSGNYRTN